MEAARRKILNVHFSEELDVQLFIEKNYKTLPPRFVAWLPEDEFSLLYRFVRNIPSFFEYGASGSKSRERATAQAAKVSDVMCDNVIK